MLLNKHLIGRTGLNYSFRVNRRRIIGGAFLKSLMSGFSKLGQAGAKKAMQVLTSESTKKLVQDVGKKALDKAIAEGGPAIGKAVSKRATRVLDRVEQKVPVMFQEQVQPVISQARELVDPETINLEVQKLARRYRAQKGLGHPPSRMRIVDYI